MVVSEEPDDSEVESEVASAPDDADEGVAWLPALPELFVDFACDADATPLLGLFAALASGESDPPPWLDAFVLAAVEELEEFEEAGGGDDALPWLAAVVLAGAVAA